MGSILSFVPGWMTWTYVCVPGIWLPCKLWNIFGTGDAPKAKAHTPKQLFAPSGKQWGCIFQPCFLESPPSAQTNFRERAGAANSLTPPQCPGDYQTPNGRV